MTESQAQPNAAQKWTLHVTNGEVYLHFNNKARIRVYGFNFDLELDWANAIERQLNAYHPMREAAENLTLALTETALRTHGPESCGCRLCEAFGAMKAALVATNDTNEKQLEANRPWYEAGL